MRPETGRMVVQGMSGHVRTDREALMTNALLDAARDIENGVGPTRWAPNGYTVMDLAGDRTLHMDAGVGRGFAATLVRPDRRISLSCAIVDDFDHLVEPASRAVAHARWAAMVLSHPRTRDKDPTWVRTATDIAALAASLKEGSSGACTLQPGPSTDPIKVERTGQAEWRVRHTRALQDHVDATCPRYMQVTHGRHYAKDGQMTESVTIGHGPKVMCFAVAPDPIERMRLMISTGLDPADLFRVADDHG